MAIQGDPRVNNDSDAIIESALQYRQIGENIIIKVPATPVGAYALKQLIKSGIPVIATLGFSVAQAVFMAETYREAQNKQRHPRFVILLLSQVSLIHIFRKKQSEKVLLLVKS